MEWRVMVYIAPIVFKNLVDDAVYNCLLIHSHYLSILLRNELSLEDIAEAEKLSKIQKKAFVLLYGAEAKVPNFHASTHVFEQARVFGPPTLYWLNTWETKHKTAKLRADMSNKRGLASWLGYKESCAQSLLFFMRQIPDSLATARELLLNMYGKEEVRLQKREAEKPDASMSVHFTQEAKLSSSERAMLRQKILASVPAERQGEMHKCRRKVWQADELPVGSRKVAVGGYVLVKTSDVEAKIAKVKRIFKHKQGSTATIWALVEWPRTMNIDNAKMARFTTATEGVDVVRWSDCIQSLVVHPEIPEWCSFRVGWSRCRQRRTATKTRAKKEIALARVRSF